MSSSKKENAYHHASCVSHRDIDDGDLDLVHLNTALHELGMLSAITESRKQYLQEKAATNRRLAMSRLKETNPVCLKKGFCVLHMNSNYVTDLSSVWKCGLRTGAVQTVRLPGDVVRSPPSDAVVPGKDGECCHERGRSRSSRYRLHFQKPYEVPWMNRLVRQEWPSHLVSQGDLASKDASTLGNRSNPGSPEKSSGDSSSGLVRSRSLDDIEAMNPAVSSLTCQKSEIETVSQRMESLHVN